MCTGMEVQPSVEPQMFIDHDTAKRLGNLMEKLKVLELTVSTLQEKASQTKSSPKPSGNRLSLQCRRVGRKGLPPASGKPLNSSEPKPAPPAKPAPSKEALSKADERCAEVQRKMSRIQLNLEEVYGRESCDNPRSHPKVKKLNRALGKLRKVLRAVNSKRYNMRHQETVL